MYPAIKNKLLVLYRLQPCVRHCHFFVLKKLNKVGTLIILTLLEETEAERDQADAPKSLRQQTGSRDATLNRNHTATSSPTRNHNL